MARENQVNVTLLEDTRKRVERFVARYRKQNKAQVIYEIVEQYIDLYERAEEKKLAELADQGALGKAQAPATPVGRRARKTA